MRYSVMIVLGEPEDGKDTGGTYATGVYDSFVQACKGVEEFFGSDAENQHMVTVPNWEQESWIIHTPGTARNVKIVGNIRPYYQKNELHVHEI